MPEILGPEATAKEGELLLRYVEMHDMSRKEGTRSLSSALERAISTKDASQVEPLEPSLDLSLKLIGPQHGWPWGSR